MGQLREHRKREHFPGGPLRLGQAAGLVAQMREAVLQVERQRIIDRAPDALALEVRLQLVATLDAHGVLVIDVLVPRVHHRYADPGNVAQPLVVVARMVAAPRTARGRASGRTRSMAASWPYQWTGMRARVRGVIAASAAAGSMLNVAGSMSTKTGVPPALWMAPAVAKNVNGVVTTSSPGFRSSAFSGKSSASVPLAHAMPCLALASPAIAASSRGTLGPITNC